MEPKTKTGFNRRDFLKTGALSGLFLGTAGLAGCANGSARKESYKGRVKNVIFLVSDGMSHGTLQMADLMRRRLDGRPSHWIKLYEEGKANRSLMDMSSANSSVTGSASASSSWGSGRRINNGAVNISPEGEELNSLVPLFRDAGKKTGLVTTTRVTHATPAGFCASVPERGMEDEIAMQYFQRKPDVVLGGGGAHFDGEQREDGVDLFSSFAQDGYDVVKTKQELMSLNAGFRRVLGTFRPNRDHLPYTLDQLNTPDLLETIPTLAEMTQFALDSLHASGDGFILQVEGGRVDHAAHSMDAPGLIYDQIAFDDAIETAVRFYEQHPDETLVLITTDHGNANPALNAMGSGYNDSDVFFDRMQQFRHTNNWVASAFWDETPTVDQIIERIEYATRIAISREHAEFYRRALLGEHRTAYQMRSRPMNTLGEVMSNYTAVAFTGSVHTGDYVELASLGPGSEALGPFVRNTDLFYLINEAAAVPYPQQA